MNVKYQIIHCIQSFSYKVQWRITSFHIQYIEKLVWPICNQKKKNLFLLQIVYEFILYR